MAKTLADMTPAERAECVGMWVFDQEMGLLIYAGVDGNNEHLFMQPAEPDYRWDERLLQATPRFDLPRAWNPDGTPVEMDVETITTQPHPRGSWNNNPEDPEYFPTPPGTRMCRWVGEWEDAP